MPGTGAHLGAATGVPCVVSVSAQASMWNRFPMRDNNG